MDFKRIVLYMATAFVGMSLYTAWQNDYPAKHQAPVATSSTQYTVPDSNRGSAKNGNFVPNGFNAPQAAPVIKTTPNIASPQKRPQQAQKQGVVTVQTGTLKVNIGLNGGNLISSQLLNYPKSLKDKKTPITILSSEASNRYEAQSGITAGQGSLQFTSPQQHYVLKKGQSSLKVVLTAKQNGIVLKKQYTFFPNRYVIKLNQVVHNQSTTPWVGSFYNQISRDKPDHKHSVFSRGGVNGGAISSPQTPYEKLSYKKMSENVLSRNIKNGWLAMQQHYFLSAWIPPHNITNHYYSNVSGNLYTLGYVTPRISVAPGKTTNNQSTFYVGPEIQSHLSSLAHGLDLTIDYGWLAPISGTIFRIMNAIHSVVGNWGWSIILVTLLIKVLLYYPSSVSYKSMAKMRVLAPRMKALQERFKDDKQALSKATMELYKKEKANPMSGCLPMLVQIPIFISLYYVLIESVQLRLAPFVLWIHDLSVMDPYYILPIIMGASMFLQQKLSPQAADPAQAKMMMVLPLVFTVMFIHFPAGLVLYWITNNVVSMAQQLYVMKTYDQKAEDRKARSKKKK